MMETFEDNAIILENIFRPSSKSQPSKLDRGKLEDNPKKGQRHEERFGFYLWTICLRLEVYRMAA
jgi:hypothetical protein